MANILVVDDSAVDRRLVAGLLKEDPNIEVELAENGREAIEMLRNKQFDLVVTDLQMPELDGLGLVQEVRNRGIHVPVILITAHGSEELAVTALEQGASSYVPKSQLAEALQDSVEQVLSLTRSDRSYERLTDCQTRAEFTFSLLNDTELIDPLVDLVQQIVFLLRLCDMTGRFRIGMALQQALINAMVHGNLEIGSDDVEAARESLITRRDRGLLEQRQTEQPYADRRVLVDIKIDRERAEFVVRDQGPGFDVSQFNAANDGDMELIRGRGIRLMRTFMSTIEYNAAGNEVTMIKYRENGSDG